MATLSSEVDPREVAHIACDCVPDLGPEHCHLCSERAGHEVPWSECSSHSITDEQVGAAAKVLYADYASEYEYAPWELGDQTPFLNLAHAALEAARGVQP